MSHADSQFTQRERKRLLSLLMKEPSFTPASFSFYHQHYRDKLEPYTEAEVQRLVRRAVGDDQPIPLVAEPPCPPAPEVEPARQAPMLSSLLCEPQEADRLTGAPPFRRNHTRRARSRNTDTITTSLRELLLVHAFCRAPSWVEIEALVQKVQLRFAIEANAGVLRCLDHKPIERIPEESLHDFSPACLDHCRKILDDVIRAEVRKPQANEARAEAARRWRREQGVQMAAVRDQLDELAPNHREALFLYHYLDISFIKAAAYVGDPPEHFRRRVDQAMRALEDGLRGVLSRKELPGLVMQALEDEISRIRGMVRDETALRDTLALLHDKLSDDSRLGLPFIHGVLQAHEQAVIAAEKRITRMLTRKVAKLAEKYHATSAWLFVVESDGYLRASITHNSVHRGFRMPLSGMPDTGRGIVPFVAREKRGVCVADVEHGEFAEIYHRWIEETRSELAVPVLMPGPEKTVLGVLNLESNKTNKFSESSIDALQADADELILDLLCLESMKRGDVASWPWHPAIHGWTSSRLLEDICDAIANCCCKDKDDTVTATIWRMDWAKGWLHVEATCGYDYDFVADKVLAKESFTGNVARLPHGESRYGTPDCPDFVEWEKAEDMGLTYLCSAPIYAPSDSGQERAFGALNVYLLSSLCVRLVPSRQEMVELTRIIGAVLGNYELLREKVARVHTYAKMRRALNVPEEMQLDNLLATIREVLPECLHADGCSVFVKVGNKLDCVATTGVRSRPTPGARYVLIEPGFREPVSYDLESERDHGIMTFLGTHPGALVRKYLANDVDEPGVPEGLPKRVVIDKNLEHLVPNDTDDRRFLGISIEHDGETVGAIRLVRSTDSPPFTESDVALLRKLTDLCKPVFLSVSQALGTAAAKKVAD